MPIVLDVTPEQEAVIRTKAQAAGYGTPSDFLLSLVEAHPPGVDGYDEDADEGPPSTRGRTDAELEQLLVERAESSDFVEVTSEFWQTLRAEVADRRSGLVRP